MWALIRINYGSGVEYLKSMAKVADGGILYANGCHSRTGVGLATWYKEGEWFFT